MKKKESDFEILLSTMERTSLSFLGDMFYDEDFLKLNILVVNQTTKNKLLKSDYANVRIINSFEKGLSKSRNLAIENAIGNICLFADDDVKFRKNIKELILEAYKENKNADVITFQMVDDKGDLYNNYPEIVKHDKKTIKTANSVTITFKRKVIRESGVRFNINFGLGATFQNADEYIFLRNGLRASLNILFKPIIILSHKSYSSGRDVGSDRVVFALSALFYKYSGVLAYPRLIKRLFCIYRRKHITFKEILPKFNIGLKGIKEYKKLMKSGLEKR